MQLIADRLNRIKPSPSSMATQRSRALKAEGHDVVGLTAGEPDFDTAPNVIDAVMRALAASRTKYTDIGGAADLKAAIREKFRRENQLEYSQSEVMASTGGKQVIFNALMATVRASKSSSPRRTTFRTPISSPWRAARPLRFCVRQIRGFGCSPKTSSGPLRRVRAG